MARHQVTEARHFMELIELEVKKTGALAVNEDNTEPRVFGKQGRERLQVKAPIDEQLCRCDYSGNIEFLPDAAPGAGKHGFGPCLIAVQSLCKAQEPLQVAYGSTAVPVGLQFLHGPAYQIFGQDGLFAVRLILRGRWFEIKTQRHFAWVPAFKRG
jgi:hypothetical protein